MRFSNINRGVLLFLLVSISHDLIATSEAPQSLTSDEAMRFSQCRPGRFTAWYRVANGSDLSEVISQLQRQLMTTTESATEATTATTVSSDTTRLTPSATAEPDLPLDLFSGSGENATDSTFSSKAETSTPLPVSTVTESFVTVPPAQPDQKKRRKRHIATGDRVTGFVPVRRPFHERFLNIEDPDLNPRPEFRASVQLLLETGESSFPVTDQIVLPAIDISLCSGYVSF